MQRPLLSPPSDAQLGFSSIYTTPSSSPRLSLIPTPRRAASFVHSPSPRSRVDTDGDGRCLPAPKLLASRRRPPSSCLPPFFSSSGGLLTHPWPALAHGTALYAPDLATPTRLLFVSLIHFFLTFIHLGVGLVLRIRVSFLSSLALMFLI